MKKMIIFSDEYTNKYILSEIKNMSKQLNKPFLHKSLEHITFEDVKIIFIDVYNFTQKRKDSIIKKHSDASFYFDRGVFKNLEFYKKDYELVSYFYKDVNQFVTLDALKTIVFHLHKEPYFLVDVSNMKIVEVELFDMERFGSNFHKGIMINESNTFKKRNEAVEMLKKYINNTNTKIEEFIKSYQHTLNKNKRILSELG